MLGGFHWTPWGSFDSDRSKANLKFFFKTIIFNWTIIIIVIIIIIIIIIIISSINKSYGFFETKELHGFWIVIGGTILA